MRRLNRFWSGFALALVVALIASITGGAFSAGPVLAGERDDQAGVVIFFDDGDIEYHLVDLPNEEITALDLLELADLDLEIEPFSGLGEAVCSIDGTGCPGSDCFCESYSSPAYYWNFYLFEDEQWLPQMSGASQHTVQTGEVHGWAWTAGTPEFPEVTIEELRERSEQERDSPDVNSNPEPSVSPDSIGTPVREATVQPSPEADRPDDDGDDNEEPANETRCLQFTGFLSVVTAIAAWAGFRRYRMDDTS
ncbi:MAG: hypothetical protein WD401_04870 [Thermomicrobiaceae bacterium]